MSQTKAQLISGTASQDVTFDDATVNSLNGGPLAGARNRIINGDMRIDQRNAGASVSFDSSSNFPVDRFKLYNTVGSGSTAQRSTTAPAGFNNSIVFTVGTGASPGAADECRFFQSVEGFNVADLGFGTASAQAVTVSFWVRSSITGTYAFNLRNDAGNRSYVATYSINSANTWEYKTTTIAGDTSGTWETGSSTGIMLRFDLGSGSNANTTAGAWQAGNFGRTSDSVNWIATNGATFYITGVQLEAGTVATPFERRSYGQELALCQRYYEKSYDTETAPGTATSNGRFWAYGSSDSAGSMGMLIKYAVQKRAAATFIYYTGSGSSGWSFSRSGSAGTATPTNGGSSGTAAALIYLPVGSSFANTIIDGHWTASAEL